MAVPSIQECQVLVSLLSNDQVVDAIKQPPPGGGIEVICVLISLKSLSLDRYHQFQEEA